MLAQPIYVVDGARTPFLKSKNRPGPFAARDLATQAGRTLLVRQKFRPDELDEVILGCAAPSVDEVNIGRVAALRMGCGQKVPGWTVMRNCASGMQAIDSGLSNILAGRADLVMAGGVDALSRAPLLYSEKMVLWFSEMAAVRSTGQRMSMFRKLPVASLLAPVIGIMKGLTDPMVGLLMGQTAENLAHRFGITRDEMDQFSVRSHQKVARAQDEGRLAPGGGEVEALYENDGTAHALDDGVRRDAADVHLVHRRRGAAEDHLVELVRAELLPHEQRAPGLRGEVAGGERPGAVLRLQERRARAVDDVDRFRVHVRRPSRRAFPRTASAAPRRGRSPGGNRPP